MVIAEIKDLRPRISGNGQGLATSAEECQWSWPKFWWSSQPRPENPLCGAANYRRCAYSEGGQEFGRVPKTHCPIIQEEALGLKEQHYVYRTYDRLLGEGSLIPISPAQDQGVILELLHFTSRPNQDSEVLGKLAA